LRGSLEKGESWGLKPLKGAPTFLGLGDSVGGEGRKESILKRKAGFLQAFPLGWLLEGFEGFKPTVVEGEHVKGDAGLSLFKDLYEITHPQGPWFGKLIGGLP